MTSEMIGKWFLGVSFLTTKFSGNIKIWAKLKTTTAHTKKNHTWKQSKNEIANISDMSRFADGNKYCTGIVYTLRVWVELISVCFTCKHIQTHTKRKENVFNLFFFFASSSSSASAAATAHSCVSNRKHSRHSITKCDCQIVCQSAIMFICK